MWVTEATSTRDVWKYAQGNSAVVVMVVGVVVAVQWRGEGAFGGGVRVALRLLGST